jgi:hypothetical protein
MDRLKFNRDKIVERIKANRERHVDIYERAMEVYRQRAIAQLNTFVDALKAGKSPSLYISLPVPENHIKDYDAVLDMLNSSVDEFLVLSEQDFRCYVRDQWNWKSKFISTSNAYVADYVDTEE